MPRPKKCRRICNMPGTIEFAPTNDSTGEVLMSIDEYETIRLIDLEGFTQEMCAEQMRVARTTVQWIYNQARQKLADALVNGKMLRIEGGDYQICNGSDNECRRKGGSCCCQAKEQE